MSKLSYDGQAHQLTLTDNTGHVVATWTNNDAAAARHGTALLADQVH